MCRKCMVGMRLRKEVLAETVQRRSPGEGSSEQRLGGSLPAWLYSDQLSALNAPLSLEGLICSPVATLTVWVDCLPRALCRPASRCCPSWSRMCARQSPSEERASTRRVIHILRNFDSCRPSPGLLAAGGGGRSDVSIYKPWQCCVIHCDATCTGSGGGGGAKPTSHP